MENLPYYISILFFTTTIASVVLFYNAANSNIKVLAVLTGWSLIVASISATGFFLEFNVMPPRFAFVVLPPLIGTIVLFNSRFGKQFIDNLQLPQLTLLHIIRIPVELVLYWLFLHNTIPALMTFEGRNFDILSGLTAPLVFYIVFIKRIAGRQLLLTWNVICLALVAFIVVNGILSSPTPFQQFAFDQPNVAIAHFPFIWLAAVIVPICYFSHLASIRILLKQKSKEQLPAVPGQLKTLIN